MKPIFTNEELNSISFAYSSVYAEYKKAKRSRRDTIEKGIMIKILKQHLITLQSIIKNKLKIDCTFKEL